MSAGVGCVWAQRSCCAVRLRSGCASLAGVAALGWGGLAMPRGPRGQAEPRGSQGAATSLTRACTFSDTGGLALLITGLITGKRAGLRCAPSSQDETGC